MYLTKSIKTLLSLVFIVLTALLFYCNDLHANAEIDDLVNKNLSKLEIINYEWTNKSMNSQPMFDWFHSLAGSVHADSGPCARMGCGRRRHGAVLLAFGSCSEGGHSSASAVSEVYPVRIHHAYPNSPCCHWRRRLSNFVVD